MKENLQRFINIHVLEKEAITIKDVTFVCGTLWTDMNKNDPNTKWHLQRRMNDFRIVENSNDTNTTRLLPDHAYEDHNQMVEFIKKTVTGPFQKYVVIGHHAPSKQSVKPRYEGDYLTKGGYSSDLEQIMVNHPQIKVWAHGHCHDVFSYYIGSTRIECNPRGYKFYEKRADEFELKYIEV